MHEADSGMDAQTRTGSLSVKRLSLSNFRNYESVTLDIPKSHVVITGRNGAGKTNLLEAVSMLVPGRGIRNSKLSSIDRNSAASSENPFSQKPWSVFAIIETPEGEVKIGTGRDAGSDAEKRIIKIDGVQTRGQSALAEHFAVCVLTPKTDQVLSEGTTERREYLDRLVISFYPDHVRHLSIYSHAKSERGKLLSYNRPDEEWLAVLERRMAEQAVAIAAARVETLEHLQATIEKRESYFPKAILEVQGFVEEAIATMPALHAEEMFRERLKESRHDDKISGKTNLGVHRSDFMVTHSLKNIPAGLCSTGEQKALVLSITLACAKTRKEWKGAAPVLLLDEVIAHLDEVKREEFFTELEDLSAQSWMTGTDPSFFKHFLGKKHFLTVEDSKVLG